MLALGVGAAALAARRPAPRRRTGAALIAAGLLRVVADAGAEIAARGPWAFSLGDRCLAGLALLIAGAGSVIGSEQPPGGSTVGRSRREHFGPPGRPSR